MAAAEEEAAARGATVVTSRSPEREKNTELARTTPPPPAAVSTPLGHTSAIDNAQWMADNALLPLPAPPSAATRRAHTDTHTHRQPPLIKLWRHCAQPVPPFFCHRRHRQHNARISEMKQPRRAGARRMMASEEGQTAAEHGHGERRRATGDNNRHRPGRRPPPPLPPPSRKRLRRRVRRAFMRAPIDRDNSSAGRRCRSRRRWRHRARSTPRTNDIYTRPCRPGHQSAAPVTPCPELSAN